MMDERNIRSKKIRSGDRVVVIAGNAKGQSGVVEAVWDDRIVIGGVNLGIRHLKKSKERPQGGRVEVERSMHISNVCACDGEGKKIKLRVQVSEDRQRNLCYEKDGQTVVLRSIKRTKK
jgi:large subunit ribosomal protein L24